MKNAAGLTAREIFGAVLDESRERRSRRVSSRMTLLWQNPQMAAEGREYRKIAGDAKCQDQNELANICKQTQAGGRANPRTPCTLQTLNVSS